MTATPENKERAHELHVGGCPPIDALAEELDAAEQRGAMKALTRALTAAEKMGHPVFEQALRDFGRGYDPRRDVVVKRDAHDTHLAAARDHERLSNWLLKERPHEIGRGNPHQGESAAEVAIRLIMGPTRPRHECERIAVIQDAPQVERAWWMGRVTHLHDAAFPLAERERYCLHVKTPLKEFVLVLDGLPDAIMFGTVAHILSAQSGNGPLNPEFLAWCAENAARGCGTDPASHEVFKHRPGPPPLPEGIKDALIQ